MSTFEIEVLKLFFCFPKIYLELYLETLYCMWIVNGALIGCFVKLDSEAIRCFHFAI